MYRNGMQRAGVASVALGAAMMLGASDAEACGGLFCSAATPVNQAAERIVFAQNESAGRVTAVIEILYQGPAERFAWILPVAGDPVVDVSSNAILNRLQQATNPIYQVQRTWSGEGCAFNGAGGSGIASGGAGGGGPGVNGGGSVSVVSAGSAGPYDYQVIRVSAAPNADPAEEAITWLTQNGYDTGATGPDLLRPYLMDGLNLLAVRLSKQSAVGSIRPIMITYEGTEPMIPIRPTAVAANDDMGILVWVLGRARAVPLNYKTLELNEALIDWFNPQQSYNDVVTAAANETGDGQGFVTELARRTTDPSLGNIRDAFLGEEYTIAQYRNSADALSNAELVANVIERFSISDGFSFGGPFAVTSASGRRSLDGVVDVLTRHLALPEGTTIADVLAAPRCYFAELRNGDGFYCEGRPAPQQTISLMTFDRTAFLTDIEALVIQPIEQTVQLFADYAYLTRFYTTLSADEMNVDPVFTMNGDLDDVGNQHSVELVYEDGCFGDTSRSWQANIDGRIIRGEGNTWPLTVANRGDEMPVNLRILQLAASGPGEVYQDNGELIGQLLASQYGEGDTGSGPPDSGAPGTPQRARSSDGCTMDASPASSADILEALGLLGLAAWGALRRRPG